MRRPALRGLLFGVALCAAACGSHARLTAVHDAADLLAPDAEARLPAQLEHDLQHLLLVLLSSSGEADSLRSPVPGVGLPADQLVSLHPIEQVGGIRAYEAHLSKWRYVSADMLRILCRHYGLEIVDDDVTAFTVRKPRAPEETQGIRHGPP